MRYLRKFVDNEAKRRKEMLEEEKRKHEKIDEMKKTLNASKLDINEGRRILTTDHLGHPLLIRQE